MSNAEFDKALVEAAFRLAGEKGWRSVNAAASAREAGLDLAKARGRFPGRAAILIRFGRMADQAALAGASQTGPVKDRLFDTLMRRFDMLQTHRAGVLALFDYLPTDPGMALLLAHATHRSMGWMLEGAGIPATGCRGALRSRGLTAVWLWAVRAWRSDDSADLAATMAALDTALDRAGHMAGWFSRASHDAAADAASADAASPDAASDSATNEGMQNIPPPGEEPTASAEPPA
ncbi:MAG TPA: TetR family transcriptional regulator [Acetobacteraceae bacterium]|nr:TetR family transcriptional regulator [Acetobacteraceae bacterium]